MQLSTLESLGNRLTALAAPPSLAALMDLLESSETYAEFLRIVKEFVPDSVAEINRTHGAAAKMQVFAQAFERSYFPLWANFADGDSEEYHELVKWIPVVTRSMSWDDYHDFADGSWRPGYMLAVYLVENPWQDSGGARIALAEACQEYVPREIIKSAGEEIKLGLAHKLLDRTRFEAIATVGDILHYATGNCFYDNDQEQVYQGGSDLEWNRENVEVLKLAWIESEDIQEKLDKFYAWLEGDAQTHCAEGFSEILEFIEQRKEELGLGTKAKEPKPVVFGYDPQFEPSKPNQRWLYNLIHNLAVGGNWVAPMGFTFRKLGPGHIRLTEFIDNPSVREVIERTVACGRVAGMRVDTDMLEGGDTNGNHRRV